MPTVLLTGATGYIGRRLEQKLRDRNDISLRLLVRNTRKLTAKALVHADIVEGDTFSPTALATALHGVDTAIYLIHSMAAGKAFSELDRRSAENFLKACIEQKVKKIIYLGGLGEADSPSPHLSSRMETGQILSSHPEAIKTIWFRAGVIIGAGSTSFEIISHLIHKLPCMITPRWVTTPTQPIGIEDVLEYLLAALPLKPQRNIVVDIGTAPMTFLDMLRQTAQVLGLHRLILPVPLLSPKLSSYWLTLVTPVPYKIGAALVEGLRAKTLVQNDNAQQFFPHIHPCSFEEAVQQANQELERDLVLSRWCDSSGGEVCDIPEGIEPSKAIFRDIRTQALGEIPREDVFRSLSSLGGKNGWFTTTFLWKIRGWIDKACGGYGLNRGRRSPQTLRIGDALDFWKVADVVPNKRLLLLAQMKLPGKAWLEFDIQQQQLIQTAHFLPQGLLGRLYWYAVLPFHCFVFPTLIKEIMTRAQRFHGKHTDPPQP